MEIQGIEAAQEALHQSRTANVGSTVEAVISFCAEHPDGIDHCMMLLRTSRVELQQLLWDAAGATIRIADPRLVKKMRSGSSFDGGSYNYGSPQQV